MPGVWQEDRAVAEDERCPARRLSRVRRRGQEAVLVPGRPVQGDRLVRHRLQEGRQLGQRVQVGRGWKVRRRWQGRGRRQVGRRRRGQGGEVVVVRKLERELREHRDQGRQGVRRVDGGSAALVNQRAVTRYRHPEGEL